MREAVETVGGVGDAGALQQRDGALARGAAVQAFVQRQRFDDLVADGVQRVQRRHRLLEDHRDLGTADCPHLAVGNVEQVLAFETDRAVVVGIFHQAQHGQRGHGLARAGFADQRVALAGAQVEADLAHRAGGMFAVAEGDGELVHAHQRGARRRRRCLRGGRSGLEDWRG
ncbi:hypothetical protein D3C81_1680300 [compost metagenome]